jgi:hypothetical protein
MTKISILTLLLIALAVPSVMLAQSTTTQSPQANPSMAQPPDQNGQTAQPEATEPAQTQSDQAAGTSANGMSPQAQTLSGTISPDGKTLTCSNATYNISNPASVKAYAGQPVSVEYEMDTNNSIKVTKIILQRPQQ